MSFQPIRPDPDPHSRPVPEPTSSSRTADPDLLREMVRALAETLMSVDAMRCAGQRRPRPSEYARRSNTREPTTTTTRAPQNQARWPDHQDVRRNGKSQGRVGRRRTRRVAGSSGSRWICVAATKARSWPYGFGASTLRHRLPARALPLRPRRYTRAVPMAAPPNTTTIWARRYERVSSPTPLTISPETIIEGRATYVTPLMTTKPVSIGRNDQ